MGVSGESEVDPIYFITPLFTLSPGKVPGKAEVGAQSSVGGKVMIF